jgi:hypothetical protein
VVFLTLLALFNDLTVVVGLLWNSHRKRHKWEFPAETTDVEGIGVSLSSKVSRWGSESGNRIAYCRVSRYKVEL